MYLLELLLNVDIFLYLCPAGLKLMGQRVTSLPSRSSSSAFCLTLVTKTFVQLSLNLFWNKVNTKYLSSNFYFN